ncbi:MAG: hypothetical protein KatS3mg059_1524 [Thermomicrobiales bacterium]|nr:MAG: hypothetical protein KatS3mg059_1524 [Thermomicrobiales bacterium]
MAIPAASISVNDVDVPSSDVTANLWSLLLPNSRIRISPEVEFAQHSAIVCQDADRPVKSNGHLHCPPIPQTKWQGIIDCMDRFEQSGRPFHQNPYDTWPYFLEGYSIYYASRYALALEFVLMDLYRWGILPSRLQVLDVGVGPATASIAVLEFLRKLAQACQTAHVSFPVSDVQLWFLDRSQKVLDYGSKILSFYLTALSTGPNGLQQQIRVGQPDSILHDLGQPLPPALGWSPNLLMLANVVSDVLFVQKQSDGALRTLIESLQPGGVVIILEHPVYTESLIQWADCCRELNKLAPADCRIRRRVQSFEPHDAFERLITMTPSLEPKAWHFADPLNDQLRWVQLIYVK